MESRVIGQGLRSNPQGLALSDQAGRHILLRPVGKGGVRVPVEDRKAVGFWALITAPATFDHAE